MRVARLAAAWIGTVAPCAIAIWCGAWAWSELDWPLRAVIVMVWLLCGLILAEATRHLGHVLFYGRPTGAQHHEGAQR
jgi:hypothetical protein